MEEDYHSRRKKSRPSLDLVSGVTLLSEPSSSNFQERKALRYYYEIKIFLEKLLGVQVITYQENFSRDFERAMNYSMACKERPDYLFDFQQVRDSWQRYCLDKDANMGQHTKNFFKTLFHQHLRNCVFVTAFDCSDVAKLLVDYSVYCKVKEKLERKVAVKVPDIAPVRLSKRNLPCVKHMFASSKDMEKCMETLRRKNEEIVFQMEVRGVRAMEAIRDDLDERPRKVLALDLEVYENDPTLILEIGMASFVIDSTVPPNSRIEVCRHLIIKENEHLHNEDIFPDNRNEFKFGINEYTCFWKGKKALQEAAKEADYIVAHSAGNLSAYLKARGISLGNKEFIDTKLLYMAAHPNATNYWDFAGILDNLGIHHDNKNNKFATSILNNAGNDAYFTMEMFNMLVCTGIEGQ